MNTHPMSAGNNEERSLSRLLRWRGPKLVCLVALAFCLGLLTEDPGPRVNGRSAAKAGFFADIQRIANAVRFIENAGQYPPEVKFTAKLSTGTVFFCDNEIVFNIYQRENDPHVAAAAPPVKPVRFAKKGRADEAGTQMSVACFSVRYDGSNPGASPSGRHRREETAAFLIGRDASRHGGDVGTFDTLVYRELYPGVDLLFFDTGGRMKYEFHVQEAAQYRDILMLYSNVDSLRLSDGGDLVVQAGLATFVEERPVAFQIIGGTRRPCRAGYEPVGSHAIGFRVTLEDSAAPLVIDPVYSSLFGGGGVEGGTALLPLGDIVYIAGVTSSADYPAVDGAFQKNSAGLKDGFVTMIDTRRGVIVRSTYFGGSEDDVIMRFRRDPEGNFIIAGNTRSADLPVSQDAFQKAYRGNQDCFVAVLDSSCSSVVYSSYFGGTGFEDMFDMTMDRRRNVIFTGLTDSWNYPVTSRAVQRVYGGGEDDVMVTRLRAGDYSIAFSTFIGGYDYDEGYTVITDDACNVYVGGLANSRNYPVTTDAFQPRPNAIDQGFVSILDSSGSRYLYGTFVGGSGNDLVEALDFDTAGNLLVMGETTSLDLRTTPGVVQPGRAHVDSEWIVTDFSILKLDSTRGRALWWTYLGGTHLEYSKGMIVVHSRPLVFGRTRSADYPMKSPVQSSFGGDEDIVISLLNDGADSLLLSTYFGGSDYDAINDLTFEYQCLWFTGYTYSRDYPRAGKQLKDSLQGLDDAYITVLDLREVITALREPEHPVPLDELALWNMPNPFGDAGTEVVLRGPPNSATIVRLFDAAGREVRHRSFDIPGSGSVTWRLAGTGMKPGVYFATASTGARCVTRKMVKLD